MRVAARAAADHDGRYATFETIGRSFVKIAVRVEELKSRIKIAFPASSPFADGGLAAHPP